MTRAERLSLTGWWALSLALAAGTAAALTMRWHIAREHRPGVPGTDQTDPADLVGGWLERAGGSAEEKAAVRALGATFQSVADAARAEAEAARRDIGAAFHAGAAAPAEALRKLTAAQTAAREALVRYCFAVRDTVAAERREPFTRWSYETLLR